MKKNFKTPIHEILFRSSKVGLLAGGITRFELTDAQKADKARYEELLVTPIGLTDNQQSDLNKWNAKIKEGGKLTDSQTKKRDEYTKKLVTPKGLTDIQQAALDGFYEREAMSPQLSQGANTYIKEVWLQNEKGFKQEFSSKQIRKGLQGEEDALSLISYVDGIMYIKNEKKAVKGHLSGTCDANTYIKEVDARVIDDTKCSWNPLTFMQSDLSSLYEWQGRAYLYLYDADIFRLRYCLIDCPPDVLADEYKKFCFAKNIIDDSLPEYKEAIDQFYRNHQYEKSGNYSREERVKTFMFERDEHKEKQLLLSLDLGVEYYKSITLNMIEE